MRVRTSLQNWKEYCEPDLSVFKLCRCCVVFVKIQSVNKMKRPLLLASCTWTTNYDFHCLGRLSSMGLLPSYLQRCICTTLSPAANNATERRREIVLLNSFVTSFLHWKSVQDTVLSIVRFSDSNSNTSTIKLSHTLQKIITTALSSIK